ncbi:MAG: phosphotransferase [Candidatus Nanoarchaeia archaeon]|nr:phosphotransferase [Candidatus Nanoarchaeia archaeon]MDD5239283.1 phosphotransferase [Candidatus Nanoarchaeia archaeon]
MNEKYKRIKYNGRLEDISLAVCEKFNLEEFLSNNLVAMGYEDFNFSLETTKGKYFVKVFWDYRTDKDCKRYVDVMLKAKEAQIKTPGLLESKQGYLCKLKVNDANLRLCVMDFIDGKTLYESNGPLNPKEIKFLARQAALINSIDIKPKPVYDSWAIVNFLEEYKKKGKFMSKPDTYLVKPLIEEFKSLDLEGLPHCFVHGDIISTNVMKDKKGQLWIIDFAVSNYYPRIQELAVLACNLLFDTKNESKSKDNLDIALKEYQKNIKLTEQELTALPTYIKLAHAMHILGGSNGKAKGLGTPKENEYWLDLGRSGLKQMLNLP